MTPMTTRNSESDTERLIEHARAEGRREERRKQLEAARARSKQLLKELEYWSEMAKRERLGPSRRPFNGG